MFNSVKYLTVSAIALALYTFPVYSHHSRTHYADDISEMEGTLVELRWKNPHIYFMLETEEENGETKVWEMESGTIYMVGRAGVTQDMFKVGDKLRVAGNRSMRYDDRFWLTNVLLPAGRLAEDRVEVLVVARGAARWADELVGGKANWKDEAFLKPETSNQAKGIFRVWSPPNESTLSVMKDPNALPFSKIITAAASEGIENWDQDSFDNSCEKAGMPEVNFGPHPHQFIDGGDRIFLIGEEYDVTRTLHLDSAEDPGNQAYSPLGYSVAKWENENTLVVNTTRINFPYIKLGEARQSKQVEITERFVLSDDESRMDWKLTITDPVMLTAPYITTGVWVDLNEGMSNFDCEIRIDTK
jgi:hypothetical protein